MVEKVALAASGACVGTTAAWVICSIITFLAARLPNGLGVGSITTAAGPFLGSADARTPVLPDDAGAALTGGVEITGLTFDGGADGAGLVAAVDLIGADLADFTDGVEPALVVVLGLVKAMALAGGLAAVVLEVKEADALEGDGLAERALPADLAADLTRGWTAGLPDALAAAAGWMTNLPPDLRAAGVGFA